MAYDYDKLYAETPDALGAPTALIVDFFKRFDGASVRVLDVGCGQGRDALFIARRGHHVFGVDLSPNGIRDLKAAAARESLSITGIVADIAAYAPEGQFDIILIDRTLHMLPEATRHAALARLIDHVASKGWVLIADEVKNIKGFEAVLAAHDARWTPTLRKRGYLFTQRD